MIGHITTYVKDFKTACWLFFQIPPFSGPILDSMCPSEGVSPRARFKTKSHPVDRRTR